MSAGQGHKPATCASCRLFHNLLSQSPAIATILSWEYGNNGSYCTALTVKTIFTCRPQSRFTAATSWAVINCKFLSNGITSRQLSSITTLISQLSLFWLSAIWCHRSDCKFSKLQEMWGWCIPGSIIILWPHNSEGKESQVQLTLRSYKNKAWVNSFGGGHMLQRTVKLALLYTAIAVRKYAEESKLTYNGAIKSSADIRIVFASVSVIWSFHC